MFVCVCVFGPAVWAGVCMCVCVCIITGAVENRLSIFRPEEIKAFQPTVSASIIRTDYLTVVGLL